MSTKAYTGFRMKRRKFPDVLADLHTAGTALAAVTQRRQDEFLAGRASHLLDMYYIARARGLSGHDLPSGALAKAFWELMDRQNKMQQTRLRDPDVDFEIKFGMYYSPRDGSYIGCVNAERSGEVMKVFLATGVATDFAYWNNTDRPDELNDRQWKKRADTWHEVLSSDALPYFEITVPEPGFSSDEAIGGSLPSFEQRVTKVAGSLALRDWAESLDDASRTALNTQRGIRKYLRLAAAPDSSEADHLRKTRTYVESLLEPTLTTALLRQKLETWVENGDKPDAARSTSDAEIPGPLDF
ncbi:hypothetical protein [Burkholderia cenocepacia]|uniref:hypothetical protein n=1 Tax=Burkholderia cenocepacia TaxID=95486 RepID=UPI0007613DC2|nr:hypothetical protein [Burkholderia cenocepacia]KWU19194.1 hypothetical protein AS149_13180 [Burkholderia cenocepacia]